MGNRQVDRQRGARLTQAMRMRGHPKALALAAELDISPAAITKWKKGHAMSVDNACNLGAVLDVSLDWLLLGRNGPDWLQPGQLSDLERELVGLLRERPARIGTLLISLAAEIPGTSSRE